MKGRDAHLLVQDNLIDVRQIERYQKSLMTFSNAMSG